MTSLQSHQRLAGACGEGEFGGGAAEGTGGFGEGTGEEIAAAAVGVELAVVHHDAAAGQDGDRPAFEVHALVGGVADIVVDVGGAHRHLLCGVPDRDVGVAADGD